jgi:hypothetical protein
LSLDLFLAPDHYELIGIETREAVFEVAAGGKADQDAACRRLNISADGCGSL